MSDQYLFISEVNKWSLRIFAVNLHDAREFANNTHPNYKMKYYGKNIPGPASSCAAITDKQVKVNRDNLNRIMRGI